MSKTTPEATIVISTKNRREDLRQAVESALEQRAAVEVIVIDDASTDGTSEMIRSEFPAVVLHRSDESKGYIVQRNRGAALASAPIIFSLDDDAKFSSPDAVPLTLRQFDHPRVGAAALAYVDVHRGPRVNQMAPDDDIYITDSFIGTAHALRRDLFLQLGGYRPYYVHQGEELDYCIRMLGAGYVTRLGHKSLIEHYESPRRDFRRMDLHGSRNSVLYAWYNVPMPQYVAHLAGTTIRQTRFAFRLLQGRQWQVLKGLLYGYGASIHELRWRSPVSKEVYALSRELRARKPVALREIVNRLPPMLRQGMSEN